MVKNGNFTLLLICSGQEWHFCHKIDRKTFMFESKPRHVTPQINHLGKNGHCYEGFNTHSWGFEEIHGKNVHFSSKPRHVAPQIDHLGKTSTVVRVSTDIYWVSKEIDEKTFIFRVNLGM